MKCLHCKNELPEGGSKEFCPRCHLYWAVEKPVDAVKLNWLVLFSVFSLPTIIPCALSAFDVVAESFIMPIPAHFITAIYCGSKLAHRLERNAASRIVMTVLLVGGLGILSLFLSWLFKPSGVLMR